MTATISAVAEAMMPYLPAEIYPNIESAAEVAIEAYNKEAVKEMTVLELRNFIHDYLTSEDTLWDSERVALALAKFCTIRIVEGL